MNVFTYEATRARISRRAGEHRLVATAKPHTGSRDVLGATDFHIFFSDISSRLR